MLIKLNMHYGVETLYPQQGYKHVANERYNFWCSKAK